MRRERTNRSWSLWFAALIAAAGVAACSASEPVVRAEKTETGEGVLAVVAGEEISREQVEETVEAQLRELDQKRYDLLRQAIERMVAEKLLEREAGKRGMEPEELLTQEVRSKVTDPTDAEVDAFYEERKAQIPQPKEQIVDRIRLFLRQAKEQAIYDEFIDGLRAVHGARILLEPPRIEVATADSPAKGPADAPVTIVEFSDFECPFCSRVVPALEQVTSEYGDKVRLVFRQFPLRNIHPKAQKAAEASLCAYDQGRFWEMHDKLFADQKALEVAQLKEAAASLGLEAEEFASCLDSGKHAAKVEEDLQAGVKAGVSGTPALFINGRLLSGAQPFEAIAAVIDDELERAGHGASG